MYVSYIFAIRKTTEKRNKPKAQHTSNGKKKEKRKRVNISYPCTGCGEESVGKTYELTHRQKSIYFLSKFNINISLVFNPVCVAGALWDSSCKKKIIKNWIERSRNVQCNTWI